MRCLVSKADRLQRRAFSREPDPEAEPFSRSEMLLQATSAQIDALRAGLDAEQDIPEQELFNLIYMQRIFSINIEFSDVDPASL